MNRGGKRMARGEGKGSSRTRRGDAEAGAGDRFVPGKPERADILLDAPQLEAQNLALEIDDLELANLIRIGKVRLELESLDAELFLQTHLGDLLHTLDRLTSTVNLGLSLFFAPAYNFNLAAAAWYEYLELTRRWFELPLEMVEGRTRQEAKVVPPPPLAHSSGRSLDALKEYQTVRHIVSQDGHVIATVANENGQVVEERVVGRLEFLRTETAGEATEAAQKVAEQTGVDLSSLKGSGAGGKVVVSDVIEAAEASP
jgi:pyruvate/2-oxoglutarate dehydrogenase complex dihydrolipoamide acyltransferase (E2) component